jgi:hypothetical protein
MWWSPALLYLGALVAASILIPRSSEAATQTLIGVDMSPQQAGAASLGTIDPCTEMDPGDEFTADIFIAQVSDLTNFELRIDYDPDVVSIDSADYKMWLTSTGSGKDLVAQSFDQDLPGRVFLAAAETRFPESGSGVLARLHLTALNEGTSSLTILPNPPYAPQLAGRGGIVADDNGDNYFDGELSSGTVSVGQSCVPSTPVPTPRPSTPGSSPAPGGSTSSPGGADSGGGGDPSDAPDGETPGPGSESTDAPSSPIVANRSPGSGPEDTRAPGAVAGADDPDDGGPADKVSRNDSGSSVVLVIAAVLAVLALVAGGTLLALKRFRAGD